MLSTYIRDKTDLTYSSYPGLGELPNLEDKQREALLEFRNYSENLLTTELEEFRAGEIDKLTEEKVIGDKLGTDRTFRGFLGALLVGTSNKIGDEPLIKIFLFLLLLIGGFSVATTALFVSSFIFMGALVDPFDLSIYLPVIGIVLLLSLAGTFALSPGIFRSYSYSVILENPLPGILKAYDSVEENRTINSLNQLFFSYNSLPKLPEKKEEVLSKDIYLIIDKHLQESAKELFRKLQIYETKDRLDWVTCKNLYRDKLPGKSKDKDSETIEEYFFLKERDLESLA